MLVKMFFKMNLRESRSCSVSVINKANLLMFRISKQTLSLDLFYFKLIGALTLDSLSSTILQ